jgi:benzoyl-CoA reductase/2-hydroxyglutaryl-CoA dehydratase subunit BcrC/BadD/HgdB
MIKLTRFIIQNPKIFAQGIKGYLNQRLPVRMYQIIMQYINRSKVTALMPWKKISNSSAGFPIDITAAFGFFPGLPEAYAALTGCAGCTEKPIEHAESLGYGRDLCSYMKTSIGASRLGWSEDFGGNKPADAYFSCNMVCDTHLKWFENEAKIYGKPYFALDVPNYVAGEGEERLEEYIDYVEQQLWDLIKFLEKITGKKFNEKKFFKIEKDASEICSLFKEIYEFRKRFPANHYFEFVRSLMLPMVPQWNQKSAIRYYKKQLRMAQKRYGDKKVIVPGREKYRVAWEGITIWYKIDLYRNVLGDKGAHIVVDPYTYSFAARSRPKATLKDTLRQIARDHIIVPFTLNLDLRIEYYDKLIKEYDLDGIIMHANQSCRPNSTGLQDLRDALHKKWGIPVLILNTDHCDPRAYAEGPINTRIDGFVELMEEYTRKKGKEHRHE